VAKKIKKKNKRMYFDQDVQDAIVQYNSEENPIIRNKLYSDRIAYAFDKLVENIINTFKFSYFDAGFNDVKQEVVSFLVLNMHKYDATKGFKAFSYFSVVAKNYLILVNNGNYKKLKLHKDLDAAATIKELKELSHLNSGTDTAMDEFTDEIVKYFEENISHLFKKKRDIDIAYSIVELISNRKEIDNFNKKSLYLLIREMTGVNTMYITKIINVMKRHYKRLSNEFFATGTINHLPFKNIF
tara:strand:+ start:50 stop:775 length:726 start_codon:yes stop_codon:yes gene_type:complete